jgi:hypothetical protein
MTLIILEHLKLYVLNESRSVRSLAYPAAVIKINRSIFCSAL